MDLWIGPAIVAAVVSAIVSAVGWFVSSWQTTQLEQRRRDEKVHDFQVALRAEIASDRLALVVIDREAFYDEIAARYETEEGFSVVVPHSASNTIFASIVNDIHILPGEVIGPVVDYARLRETIERFVEGMRGQHFRSLSAARQLTIYGDYLRMLGRLEVLADNALVAIDRSLGSSNRGEAPPNQSLEPALDEAPVVRDAARDEKRGEP